MADRGAEKRTISSSRLLCLHNHCEFTFSCEVALADHYQSHHSIVPAAETSFVQSDTFTSPASFYECSAVPISHEEGEQIELDPELQIQSSGINTDAAYPTEPVTVGDWYNGAAGYSIPRIDSSYYDAKTMSAERFATKISDISKPLVFDVSPEIPRSLGIIDAICSPAAPNPGSGCSCVTCMWSALNNYPFSWKFHCVYRCFSSKRSFSCREQKCSGSFKRLSDLLRHTTTIHCLCPPKFPCNVAGCKYGGENGFTRKDKLQNHQKRVHQNNATLRILEPGKAVRAILPRMQE